MENLNSNSDSGLAAWASSFSGAADPKLYPSSDHIHHRQHSQGLSSQSRSYQPSQLTFLTSADDHPPATPPTMAKLGDKEAAGPQPPLPPPLPPHSPSLTAPTSTPAVNANTAVPPPVASSTAADAPGQPRRAEEGLVRSNTPATVLMTTAAAAAAARSTRSLTHSHTHNGEAHTSRYSSSSSSTLPHPSKIPPAAVAAAAAVMHPFYTAHPCHVEEGDVGADMEVKRECLEDYLDLQDDDDDDSSADGDVIYGTHSTVAAGRSSSQSSRANTTASTNNNNNTSNLHNRSSLWMTDLCDMTGGSSGTVGGGGASHNTNRYTAATGRDSDENPLQRSPCTPMEAGTRSGSGGSVSASPPLPGHNVLMTSAMLNTATATTAASAAGLGAGVVGVNAAYSSDGAGGRAPPKRVPPPPLSGFTPVVTASAGSTPPRTQGNNNNNNNNTNNVTNAKANRAPSTSAVPQPLSLGSSSKVSPCSHQSSADLIEEERRLREELQALRQRVWETEQKLTRVQQRLAESSMHGAANAFNTSPTQAVSAVAAVQGSEGPRFMQSPPQQQQQQQPPQQSSVPQLSVTAAQAESRSLDPAAATAGPSTVYVMANSGAGNMPRYNTVGVPQLELRATPTQQQQQQQQQQQHASQLHMVAPSMGSKMYMSSAPPSASVTMARPSSSDPSGLASSGVTYFVQNSSPFGVYAVPPTGTLMDATGNPIQATAAGPWATAQTASAPPNMQLLSGQPYVVNNQPTVCYMVMAPQQQPQQQQQQQQQLTASGIFSASMPPPPPPMEFGSFNANVHLSSTVGGSNRAASGGLIGKIPGMPHHLPVFPSTTVSNNTTTTTTAAAAPGAVKADGAAGYSPQQHLVMVGPASNGELTRKCFNVHGSMMGVVPYFPYDESAPPAPTATILTAAAASPGASMLNQSMSGIGGWSTRSINGATNAEAGLSNSCRSHDGGLGINSDAAANASRSCGSNTPPNPRGTPPTPADLSSAPVLPIFIQMFPCELHDRATVLNRVMEAACGRDFAVVQRIEPRSETSFIAHVRTHQVWQLIYKLRCRVLMDRFGFWYAADLDQYVRMKEYCEGVRRLPQQTRHFQTDGLPCMPLVVELSRAVDKTVVTENNAPRTFDEIVPIAAVDRHRTRLHPVAAPPTVNNNNNNNNTSTGTVPSAGATAGAPPPPPPLSSTAGSGSNPSGIIGFPGPMSNTGLFGELPLPASAPSSSSFGPMLTSASPLQQQQQQRATMMAGEMAFLTSGNSLGGSARAGQAMHGDARQPPPPPFM